MRIQLKWKFQWAQTKRTIIWATNRSGQPPPADEYEELPTAENAGPPPLLAVARCMALARVTEGGAPFHEYTYSQAQARILQWIMDDARSGRMRLVDGYGRPGTFNEIVKRELANGWHRGNILYIESGVPPEELNAFTALYVYATLGAINAWASEHGDEFYLEQEDDCPLHGKERNTRAAIIAVLAEKAGIDIHARGASTKITKLTDLKGLHIDDGTVRKVLSEDIPAMLKSREK